MKQPDLKVFLKKVQLLRGYGDMDAYRLVSEYSSISDSPETEVVKLISEFESLADWKIGKQHLIENVKSLLERAS